MAPIECHRGYTERSPLKAETIAYIGMPLSDGSLDIATARPDAATSLRFGQAIRASEIGKPEKDACGDMTACFRQIVRSPEGSALATVHITVLRDFLSLAREDTPFWQSAMNDPELKSKAEMLGIPWGPTTLPDALAASLLRKDPLRYGNALFSAFTRPGDRFPFESLLVTATDPEAEILRHNLGTWHGTPNSLTGAPGRLVGIPQAIESVDDMMFHSLHELLQSASQQPYGREYPPSVGLGGDVQALVFHLQIHEDDWRRQFPDWRGPVSDICVILRSSADEVLRVSISQTPQWMLYAENNNNLADFHYSQMKIAGYGTKPHIYWMTGVPSLGKYITSRGSAFGGRQLTFSVIPLPQKYDLRVEMVSDGALILPPRLSTADYGLPGDTIQTPLGYLMKLAMDGDQTGYEHYLRMIKYLPDANPGGWIRDASALDLPMRLSATEYPHFLRIRRDLGLQRADDFTTTGYHSKKI